MTTVEAVSGQGTTRDAVLDVKGLSVTLRTPRGTVRAVNEVSFQARAGQTLALLGESGCGKSMTAKAIAGLLDPVAEVDGGQLILNGQDLATMSARQRRKVAGPQLGIVFQDALTALNPVYKVGTQLGEAFRIHQKLSARQARAKAIELMQRVGIPEPESRVDAYPHQFSGGMRQRILIAMAVALNPSLLIADEPTTALDVTIQAQIMALLKSLREENNLAVVLITHDLAVVAEEADTVAVMYAGNVVETGTVAEVFANPRHPYTKGLLESVPVDAVRGSTLSSIPGNPPELHKIPSGCVYQSRCPLVQEVCRTNRPELLPVRPIAAAPADGSGAGALPAVAVEQAAACHFSKELTHV
jgi:oligopeptide transport system ATP-binding protein